MGQIGHMVDIIYTTVDEVIRTGKRFTLAYYKKFLSAAGLQIEKCDISLAGRIIAMFPEILQMRNTIVTICQLWATYKNIAS